MKNSRKTGELGVGGRELTDDTGDVGRLRIWNCKSNGRLCEIAWHFQKLNQAAGWRMP